MRCNTCTNNTRSMTSSRPAKYISIAAYKPCETRISTQQMYDKICGQPKKYVSIQWGKLHRITFRVLFTVDKQNHPLAATTTLDKMLMHNRGTMHFWKSGQKHVRSSIWRSKQTIIFWWQHTILFLVSEIGVQPIGKFFITC